MKKNLIYGETLFFRCDNVFLLDDSEIERLVLHCVAGAICHVNSELFIMKFENSVIWWRSLLWRNNLSIYIKAYIRRRRHKVVKKILLVKHSYRPS